MSDEIEYIEPTQEHVGQMIKVRQSITCEWKIRKLLAILPSSLRYPFICQDLYSAEIAGLWKFARIPRPLTYAERQAKCGLKVGDRVRITRTFSDNENGFPDTFNESMSCRVGTIQTISRLHDWGIRLERIGFNWPYFVLEKVEDRIPSVLDHMAKVYVVGSPEDEFVICHMFSEIDRELQKAKHFAVVRKNDKRFVYELSNLRVKE